MNESQCKYRLNQKAPHILILILMCSFASMGAILFTPALPEIAEQFGISAGHSQLTITLFLLGYTIGQLIYGPLANRFGRKPAFIIGVFIASLGSLLGILSGTWHSFELLIWGRVLQALGSSAGLVLSFTIINDHYFAEQSRSVISYMMLSFAIVPGVATLIGGILVSHFQWVSCFYFLLCYGLVLGVVVSLLSETGTNLCKQALQFRQIKAGYALAFKDNVLRRLALFLGLSGMCVYIYAATAPFIAINYLEISPQFYGVLGLIPYIGTALGSMVSVRLSSVLSARTLIQIGLFIAVVVAIVFALSYYFDFVSLWVLIACGFSLMFGNCLIMGNASSMATSKVENKAHASAAMNFINVGMSMCGMFVVALVSGEAIAKLALSLLLTMVVLLIIWSRLGHLTQPTHQPKQSTSSR